MARVLVVRHGESVWNAESRWQGWADPPLSALGEEQANEAATRLRGAGLVAVASSDLQRARRTASIVAAGLGLAPVTVDPDLRERDVGAWSGLTTDEIEGRWPGMIRAWRRGEVPRPPDGETTEALTSRAVAALGRVAAGLGRDGPVLVVSHGGVVRALERAAGLRAATAPNLGGRWFSVSPSGLAAGEAVSLTDPDTPAIAPVF
jgi:glucosyl-3-phosphoglycerate phosphatase